MAKKKDLDLWRYRVKPDEQIRLRDMDPEDTSHFDGGKAAAEERSQKLCHRLDELQEILYAERKHKVLVIFQAMDTAGKDSTIRSVFKEISPQGVRVANFKVPKEEELAHDYLWRVHHQVPAKGEIVIFNRSHYEDTLAVRVHHLVSSGIWRKRYGHINDFERMLIDEGTTIFKFFLHIDQEEQRRRLQERLDDPHKRWKFRSGDLEERKLWPQYMKAYEDALSRTSTPLAPWYIIPANKKWYRNLIVSGIIVKRLEQLNMKYPQAEGRRNLRVIF